MNLSEIKRLIKLVEASNIEELEIKEEGLQVRITKGGGIAPPGSSGGVAQIHQTAPQVVPSVHTESLIHEAKVSPLPEAESDNLLEVRSPMVGTFYRAPAPDADPYVKEGEQIHPGKVLCIIEAMKLMNEIEAEVAGKIVKIMVENGQPVEYDQPLFLVEKS
jgi:acetyl-CoA carboxylase biotin carboxyl carrier protein